MKTEKVINDLENLEFLRHDYNNMVTAAWLRHFQLHRGDHAFARLQFLRDKKGKVNQEIRARIAQAAEAVRPIAADESPDHMRIFHDSLTDQLTDALGHLKQVGTTFELAEEAMQVWRKKQELEQNHRLGTAKQRMKAVKAFEDARTYFKKTLHPNMKHHLLMTCDEMERLAQEIHQKMELLKDFHTQVQTVKERKNEEKIKDLEKQIELNKQLGARVHNAGIRKDIQRLVDSRNILHFSLEQLHHVHNGLVSSARMIRDTMDPRESLFTLQEAIDELKTIDKIDALPSGMLALPSGLHEIELRGRRTLFVRALANAIHNASNADASKIKVEFAVNRTKKGRNFLHVSISDNGKGIAPEHLPHIGEKYYTTRKGRGGTGLGVAFFNRVFKKHGGSALPIVSKPRTRVSTRREGFQPVTVVSATMPVHSFKGEVRTFTA